MEITQETVLELNPKIAAEKGSSAESFFDLKLNEIVEICTEHIIINKNKCENCDEDAE